MKPILRFDLPSPELEDGRQIVPSKKGAGMVDILSGILIITEASSAGHIGKLGAQAQMSMLQGVNEDQLHRLSQGGTAHLVASFSFTDYRPTVREALVDGLAEAALQGYRVHTIQATWFTKHGPEKWGGTNEELRALTPGIPWIGLRPE